MSDEQGTAEDLANARRGRRGGLHIQSKLLVMLLSVSLLATVIVGVVGYLNGRDSLRQAAFDRVTSLRESRAGELERTIEDVGREVVLGSRNASATEAVRAFSAGFAELESVAVTDEQRASVASYYESDFVPALEERSGQASDPSIFIPVSPAQTYLQSYYTAPFTDFDEAVQLDDAGDGSSWSAASAQFNDYFRELVLQSGFEDALLLDTEGNVVYSVYSGVDLGTNVRTGPFAESALAGAYEEALRSSSIDASFGTDFERYAPSLNVPTAWVASPVGDAGEITGVLAIQIPIDLVNAVMTGDGEWREDGLGATGEAYVAGPDETMRSVSRLLVEDPEAYEDAVVSAGTSPEIAARAVAIAGTVLLQPVTTEAVGRALEGETGTIVSTDYLGREALTAYTPLDLAGLQWVLVAKIDAAEAFAPVDEFTRNILLSTVAIIVIVSLLSLLLAQIFLRPLRRLQEAVGRVSAGEVGVEVSTRGGDEFAELGGAFNEMSRNLRLKQDLIDEQRRENDRLLLTMMPQSVVDRYKQGEETIAQDHQDVSVVYADIVGFDDFSQDLGSAEGLGLLNGLWRSFDDAAERHGIEKVRSTRRGYLASCGLSVPRVDNARRSVEFTLELLDVLARFNAQHSARIELRAGIDTGTVTSGLLGKSSVVFDMWGDAVNLAYRVQGTGAGPGIYATQRVVDKLVDTGPITDAGVVETKTGPQRVWRLDADPARV